MLEQLAMPGAQPARPFRADGLGNTRELGAIQAQLFREHLLRLEADCRRSRFGNRTSDAFLREYAERLDLKNTRVFGFFIDGCMRGAVELRSLRSDWCSKLSLHSRSRRRGGLAA
jgi:hypothetical protein